MSPRPPSTWTGCATSPNNWSWAAPTGPPPSRSACSPWRPAGTRRTTSHDVEHVNYVISGQGALVDAEGRLNPLATGDFAFVAPGDVHQFRNTGAEPFVFICAVPKSYE
ncbi:MAG: cupin domain-containing protein [bacterium]|nr:cupin domain-containing protein [bacterium]